MVMRGRLAVMPLLAAYAVLAVPQLPVIVPVFVRVEPLKIADLTGLLSRPEIALVAWIHFLVFDLFVGRWIYRDGGERDHRRNQQVSADRTHGFSVIDELMRNKQVTG